MQIKWGGCGMRGVYLLMLMTDSGEWTAGKNPHEPDEDSFLFSQNCTLLRLHG